MDTIGRIVVMGVGLYLMLYAGWTIFGGAMLALGALSLIARGCD